MGKLPGVGLIEQVAKLFGKRVVFFRVTEGADFFDGTILESDSAIFVNVASDKAHLRILGHELVHDIRKTAPKVYQQLVKALQPMLNERGFAKYTELQKSEGVQTADKILEEAIGDIVGDRFGEPEFWQMMADNNPSTFKDVARAVMSFIDRLLGKIGNQTLGSETLVKDLRAARSEIAKILAQSTSGEGTAPQGSGPAFARKRDGVARDNTAAYVTDKELRKVRAILPDHPDAAEHLRMRELHLSKGTGDYKNERRVLEKDGFRFVIGRVTTQDWIDRVLSAMTPQEVLVFRHWYRDTVGEFKAKFGDRWQEYMIAYLLGNKAESPRGALNNALFVAETTGAGGRSERLGGLSDEQMKQIFAGEAVSLNGIGAKLYDFVDSALGKTTRSWMGNAIEGASPFVVDRHTFRDSGRVDPLLRDWLERKFGAEAVRGIVLDTPVTGSVSSAQYEQITDWGNALADDLNSRGFGGGNLMPLEVQAIGWMAMTRLTETNAGGTTEGAMAGMTKTVAAELDFGAGTPFSKKFAAYYDLSKEAQKRVTHEALREVMAVAGELTGVRLVDVTPGIGGWADVVSPNVVARFMSSDQTAEALVATVAYLGQQTSVLALHPANAATGDRVSFEITGPDMSDSFVESTLWKAISKELEPVFGRNIGFMPSVGPDGAPSIRIAIPLPFGNKKNGEPKTVKDFNVGERLELERRLVDQVSPAIERALGSMPSGTYEFDYMRVKGVESVNEWTKKGEQNGESHKQRVGERFGPEVQGRLDSVGVPRVERAIIAAIRRENPAASFSRKRKTPAAPDSRGVPQSRGVRGGDVSLEVDGRQDQRIGEPLEGGPRQVNIPGVGLVRVGKFQPAVEAAQAYMARAGLQYTPPKTFARVDPDRARRIADEYDRMPHDPGNPEVRAAYDAMIAETVAQYRAILDTGLQIEFIDYAKTGDPYAASPRLAIQDVIENNHLWVFSTADGFGSNEAFTPDQNPLLRDTGFAISGKPALANDLFRVVHDYFGHIKNGVGFRADGEENAWRAHSAMYSPLARRAMTSETRGQNSWVNFGPQAGKNKGASAANTVYADQKTGLLPEWVSTEGAEDAPSFSRKRDVLAGIDDTVNSISPGRRTFIKRMVGMAVAISLPQSRAFASNFNSSVRNGNLQGALSAIETGSTNPAFRTLAKKLKGLTNNTMSLTLVEPGKVYPRGIPASLSFGAAGVARVNRQNGGIDIFLRSDVGANEETLLHEAIHAALLARYDLLNVYLANKTLRGKNADPALKLYESVWNEFYSHVNRHFKRYKGTALVEDLRGSLPLGVQAAYQNPDEFITYALTDPETQAWMQSRKYDGKSLWGRFKEFVASTLGFGGTTPSWLDAALRVGNEVLDQAAQDAPDYATSKAVAKKFGKNEGIAMAVTPVENRGSVEDGDAAPSFSRKRDPHKDAEQKKLNEGPSWFQDLPPEAQESLRKVGAVPAKLSFRDRVDALKENLASRMVQGIFDPYAPIAKLGDVPYKQARMSTNVTGAFGHIVTDGEVKWEGGWLAPVKGSKGMLDILKQLPEGEVDRFMWWIAANRAEKLSREEREFLFSGRDIAVLKRLNMPNMGTKMPNRIAVYAKVLKELNQLNKSVLDMAKQSGLINQEQYARFAADAFYIPFYRVMEDGDVAGPATAAGLVGQQFSKRLKGGREQLNDLLANYMNNWEHIIHASAKNMAGRSTLDAAVDAGIATEVKGDPPKGSVKVMVDGKPKHFTVSDPLVFDAISSIYTPALQGMGVKIGSAFKRVFTRTVTASPTFKFYNNLIRDAITSQAISPELSNNPIANTYRGFKLMSKDNPLYDSMLVGGGLFKFSTWDEGDRHEYVKRLIDKGVDSKTILNTPDKIKAFMSNVWGKYMEVGDRAENAQRAAIYDAAIKAGKSQLEASFAARQVIDFSLTGKWAAIRYAAAVLPFFNARLQGMYSLGKLGIAPTIRASRDKDASLSDKQRAARFSAVTLAVTAATIALYLANYEDEDFKRREDWDRDSFWWIKINGVSWRIPKPFEIGAFATIVERGLEQIVDKSVEGKVFGKRLWAVVTDQLSINLIPQLIRPAFDVYSNKDGFRETDIESPGMRRLPIEDRVGANTSYAARAMGAVSKEFADILEEVIGKETADKFQFSPVQIDYLIKGYLGWVGTQALMLSDAAVRAMSGIEAPTPRFQERIPVRLTLGNTIQELPTSSSRYVGDFYRQAREINEIMAAIREYERARDFDKARELREKEEDKVQLSGLYSRTQRSLSEINKELRRIRDDADMNADEKRARIDQLEEIREEYAKSAEDTRKARR